MKPHATYWCTAAVQWAEICAFAPLVIGERLWAAATAGSNPSAQHQAEMTKMVVEKGEALAEAGAAVWLAWIDGQQLAWQRAWRAGRATPIPADFELAASTARKYAAAWRPVSRRVSANAKRLAAGKRRRR